MNQEEWGGPTSGRRICRCPDPSDRRRPLSGQKRRPGPGGGRGLTGRAAFHPAKQTGTPGRFGIFRYLYRVALKRLFLEPQALACACTGFPACAGTPESGCPTQAARNFS